MTRAFGRFATSDVAALGLVVLSVLLPVAALAQDVERQDRALPGVNPVFLHEILALRR